MKIHICPECERGNHEACKKDVYTDPPGQYGGSKCVCACRQPSTGLMVAAVAARAATASDSNKVTTAFSELSETAQDLIVRSLLGEFDDAPPADIPASVKEEIAAWASTEEHNVP